MHCSARGALSPVSCPRFTKDELDTLDVAHRMSTKFGWMDGTKPFQAQATCAQLTGTNVVVHASTGSGKTAIAAGPHTVPNMEGMVTLFVAPLLTLHTEMTKTFKEKYHLSVIAVNSLIEGSTKDIFKIGHPNMPAIKCGKYQIVILAPEMLLHRRFVDAVLKDHSFRQRIVSVVIDEAHCISHWGDDFRRAYGALGAVRVFLLPRTSIVAMSGTLTSRVRHHICNKLGFLSTKGGYLTIDEGNARPNISVASLPMQHPVESCRDADMVIPPTATKEGDIPKTFLYCDDKDTIYSMVDHLRGLLPSTIDPGVIRPFTASQSPKYRDDVMAAFKAGKVRVLVCTEAAGMGCDVSDVFLTVQWKTAHTMSSAIQRAGRTARGQDRTGVFIQFNEPASYRVDPTNPPASKPAKTQLGPKGKGKRFTEAPLSGAHSDQTSTARNKQSDQGFRSDTPAQPEIRDDSPGEGIYCFVQTTLCRRQVWDQVFYNTKPYTLNVPCCDLCDPSFLRQFHFTPPQKATRAPRIPKGQVVQSVVQALKVWRDYTFDRDYPVATWDSPAFMPDAFIDMLATVNPHATLETLSGWFGSQWTHWTKYQTDIQQVLLASAQEVPRLETQTLVNPGHTTNKTSTTLTKAIRPGSSFAARPSKRPRLEPYTQPERALTKRKGNSNASQYETVHEGWIVQPSVHPEEYQTQAYSQDVFQSQAFPLPWFK